MTTVTNLRTGAQVTYDQPPQLAVILAYRQLTEKNHNWWSEGYYDVKTEVGNHTVFCGDWCAFLTGEDGIIPCPTMIETG